MQRASIAHLIVTHLSKVVANCPIGESFSHNYEQSTPSFHMWRDSTKVYGIKFYSPEDADLFVETIRRIAHTFDQLQQLIEDTNAVSMELSSGALCEQPALCQPVSPAWTPGLSLCGSTLHSQC